IGQDVAFTVDADPGKKYKGKVLKQGEFPARLNASLEKGVVTYTAVVSVDNKDMRLWPYWTADLQFIVDQKDNALLVPNAALNWKPALQQVAPDDREWYS